MNLRAGEQQYPLGDDLYWSSWDATLITRAATARGINGENHVAMVGGVYVLAAQYRRHFHKGALPFHQILDMKPAGLAPSTDGLLDHSEISFDVKIAVRDDAWPHS